MMSDMDLETIIQLPTVWTGAVGTFGVHVYEGPLSIPDMDHMDAVGESWRKTHPGKSVELSIVHPSEARFNEQERKRFIRLVRRWEHERAASATVILATGLLGAMQRSILTGVMLIAPAPHPAKVFGDIPAAVVWIKPFVSEILGRPVGGKELLDAVMDHVTAFRDRDK